MADTPSRPILPGSKRRSYRFIHTDRKDQGRLTPQQQAFIAMVQAAEVVP